MGDEVESLNDQGAEQEAAEWDRQDRARNRAKSSANEDRGNNQLGPAKGFASLAQLRRCDGLVEVGTITREAFERDLLATDVENIPWRKGPEKPDDGTPDSQAAYRASVIGRKAALAAGLGDPIYRGKTYSPVGEGLQEGGEGLEAGRP